MTPFRFDGQLHKVASLLIVLARCGAVGVSRGRPHHHRTIPAENKVVQGFPKSMMGPMWAQPSRSQHAKNVVLIMADDLGWADVASYYAESGIPTPNIDSIGADGVRFTDAYATAPTCSPSRAATITGRYQQRFGFEFNAGGAWFAFNQSLGIDGEEITIADVMRTSGRRTALIGKWHLGSRRKFHPVRRGFDEFYGFLAGQTAYIDSGAPYEVSFEEYPLKIGSIRNRSSYDEPCFVRRASVDVNKGRDEIIHNEEAYLTEEFTREAVEFIRRNAQTPFFLEVAYNAPHLPLQTTQKYYDRFPHINDDKRRVYSAMISALDDGVGEILRELDRHGLAANTIVVFMSDNGCPIGSAPCTCEPLRGGKLSMFEGGVRIPLMMRWPAGFRGFQVSSQIVSTLDILPTVAAAVGMPLPPIRAYDGANLVPYLQDPLHPGRPHERVFWRSGPGRAVRDGDMKMWESAPRLSTGISLLFNLSRDMGEKKDLSSQAGMAKVKEDLATKLKEWDRSLVSPYWDPRLIETTDCGGTFRALVSL